jgi:hypothetical protein
VQRLLAAPPYLNLQSASCSVRQNVFRPDMTFFRGPGHRPFDVLILYNGGYIFQKIRISGPNRHGGILPVCKSIFAHLILFTVSLPKKNTIMSNYVLHPSTALYGPSISEPFSLLLKNIVVFSRYLSAIVLSVTSFIF